MLVMLPAALFALVRDHGATRDDFRSIRLCVSGGDKVSAELEREFTDLAGFPIDESYGMTEIGICNLNPPSGVNRLGSVGTSSRATRLRSATSAARSCRPAPRAALDQMPCNMIGYWNQPDATAETIQAAGSIPATS